MAKRTKKMSANACVDTTNGLPLKWCKPTGHTMSHVDRENRHVTFDGEMDVLVKTMGGGVVINDREGNLRESAQLYFNKASNDILLAFEGQKFRVDTIHIPYRGTFVALVEDPTGCKLYRLKNGNCRDQFRLCITKNRHFFAELNNGRHIRSPKFSAWLLDEEHNGGLTTIVLVPAERMVI